MKFTKEQKELLGKLESELRRETALQYIKNGYSNKKQAYLSACKVLGKKPSKNPDVSCIEILGYPSVLAFLNSVKSEVAESVQIDASYVLNRLKQIDELDIIDIVEDDLKGFKPISEWPKAWRTSISGIDISQMIANGDQPIETLVKKIKWPDKVKNLELIGKHVDIKAWDKEQEKTDTADVLAEAMSKLADKLPS